MKELNKIKEKTQNDELSIEEVKELYSLTKISLAKVFELYFRYSKQLQKVSDVIVKEFGVKVDENKLLEFISVQIGE